MTNTYAINTTRGQEFAVEDALKALGLKPWVPRRLEHKMIKEKKGPVWYDKPYVPKLMFCVIPAIWWRDMMEIKHIIGKPFELSRRDLEGQAAHYNKASEKWVPEVPGLATFQRAVEAEYADAQRRKANNEYQCLYKPGQALELLDGPFSGFRAEFRQAIKQAHNEYARLRVEVNIFGRPTDVEVDPDKVRAWG